MADGEPKRLSPPPVKPTVPPGTAPSESRRVSYDSILGKPGVVANGGGAAPTLGTIGGSGPAAAAQAGWARMVDDNGVPFFVPAWR